MKKTAFSDGRGIEPKMRMTMKKVELLAPAGNYESFLGAVHAGADAVYLGGMKFGARAYADNFTGEEVCRAVRYAHVYGRKVYLTLNTLVKTREFDEIYDYLLPFYHAGLDGVIIQDIGVFQAVGRWFPGLARHVSTQMAVTGKQGVRFLQELGAERIVPARELSLEEIREITEIKRSCAMKDMEKGVEIETFIHGAICYCYSGRCLFSSIIGGRSGNRGRCAQPCRLPYRMQGENKESYPFSLKDMCTLEILPELIEAGIDSFKIEGRMKSPEYAAGVTALYRKYIDLYYQNPKEGYKVAEEDMEKLRALYIRSEIGEGYYHRHNGRQMITMDSPAYAGRDEVLAERIRKEYIEGDFRLPVTAKAVLKKGAPAVLCLCYTDKGEEKRLSKKTGKGTGKEAGKELGEEVGKQVSIEISAEGETVQPAIKQPLSADAVRKQLMKSGNTVFRMQRIETELEEDVFLPVKALNDLRRMACEKLEAAIVDEYGTGCREHMDTSAGNMALAGTGRKEKEERGISEEGRAEEPVSVKKASERTFHVLALTKEQCMAAIRCKVKRLYLPSELCGEKEWLSRLREQCGEGTELYLALPLIIRMRDEKFLKTMERRMKEDLFEGVLVRNMEELYWVVKTFGETGWKKRIVTDTGLYIWNPEAASFFERYAAQHYLPYELNSHEIRDLMEHVQAGGWAAAVYGRIPMMVTANCIIQTGTGCQPYKEGGRPVFNRITDRYRKDFPVYTDCMHCYNVIYNSVPLSLHQKIEEMERMGIHTFRLDFTTETGNDADRIIRYFTERMKAGELPPYKEYTNGHWKRGVE